MKTKNLLTIAALALMTAACGNDDDLMQQPAEQTADNNEITVTATLAPKSDGITRAVAYNGTTITSSWAEGEQIAILFNISGTPSKRIAEVKSVDAGTATIEFTIPATGVNENAPATLVYPATAAKDDNSGAKAFTDLLAEQDGTLKADLDVRVGTGTISPSTSTLTVPACPDALFAIFKLTLNKSIDATHPLYIYDGTDNLISTVTPTSSTEEPYVAMPATGSSAFYSFVVDVDNNKYYKSGTATINPGYFYTQVMNLATRYPRALAGATKIDLGCLIGHDGNIYANAGAATTAGTTAEALITYVGNDAETNTTYNHGLALALSDASTSAAWCSQTDAACLADQYYSSMTSDMAGIANTDALVGHATHTHAAASAARNYNSGFHPTGTSDWFLPSAGQWQKMIDAAGGYSNLMTRASLQSAKYWSSTEDIDVTFAWRYDIVWGGEWNYVIKDFGSYVRSALAF